MCRDNPIAWWGTTSCGPELGSPAWVAEVRGRRAGRSGYRWVDRPAGSTRAASGSAGGVGWSGDQTGCVSRGAERRRMEEDWCLLDRGRSRGRPRSICRSEFSWPFGLTLFRASAGRWLSCCDFSAAVGPVFRAGPSGGRESAGSGSGAAERLAARRHPLCRRAADVDGAFGAASMSDLAGPSGVRSEPGLRHKLGGDLGGDASVADGEENPSTVLSKAEPRFRPRKGFVTVRGHRRQRPPMGLPPQWKRRCRSL